MYFIDGCGFVAEDFTELTKENLNSKLDAFFLTIPGETDGYRKSTNQIGRIYNLTDDKNKKLTVARTVEDIMNAKKEGKKSIILTFQNPHPIENSMEKLRVFYELGVRVIQMTYNKAGYIGAGCIESVDHGLTDFGKQMLEKMNDLGMVADISHCGHKTGLDVLKYSQKPIVMSHACVKAITDNPRNKTDEELLALKKNGGVIGISPWGPLCWNKENQKRPTVVDYVNHIEYVINLIGIDHVGFGGDNALDGYRDEKGLVEQSTMYSKVVEDYNQCMGMDPDTRQAEGILGPWQIENVINELKNRGYSDSDIGKFTGENFMRVLKANWK